MNINYKSFETYILYPKSLTYYFNKGELNQWIIITFKHLSKDLKTNLVKYLKGEKSKCNPIIKWNFLYLKSTNKKQTLSLCCKHLGHNRQSDMSKDQHIHKTDSMMTKSQHFPFSNNWRISFVCFVYEFDDSLIYNIVIFIR